MAIDSLATFQSTFAALPLVETGVWTTNFSDWLDARVTAKAEIAEVTHAVTPFTFDKATFKSELDKLGVTNSRLDGATAFANAWRVAIDSSTFVTLAGDFVNPPPATSANTWSVVTSSIIDTSSKDTAEAQIITDIVNASNVLDPLNSDLPKILRDAFLNLTISITGLNSVAPTPAPLNVSGASLL
ncbi:MAG: hypothetical protein JSU91_01845 [Thermoplasmatales archaeon]|nr:MAG: hypothetical protein JSU91_01845 [Thermoplasmatales archaeon]